MRRSTSLFALVFAVLVVVPTGASAHTETIDDANDVSGDLDIRSAGVGHRHSGRVIVHHVQTFGDWSAGTLGDDSFFVILIDNAGTKRSFERCAFAFRDRHGLRGALTNCRSNFITRLDVDKVGADALDIKIDRSRLGSSYRWAAETVYTTPSGACRGGCVDSAPNDFPLPLHDVAAPIVEVSASLLPSDVGTTSTVDVDYSASDIGGAGLERWAVSRRLQDGSSTSEDLQTGTTATSSSLQMADLAEGSTYALQVTAGDGQENTSEARTYVSAPWDDASPDLGSGYAGSWTTSTPGGAYGQTLHTASGEDASLEYTMSVPADLRVRVIWVAPGTGNWSGTLAVSGFARNTEESITAFDVPDLPRQRVIDLQLNAVDSTTPLTISISVDPGGGAVPIDALAVIFTPRGVTA